MAPASKSCAAAPCVLSAPAPPETKAPPSGAAVANDTATAAPSPAVVSVVATGPDPVTPLASRKRKASCENDSSDAGTANKAALFEDVVSALNSDEGGMSAFESLLSVYETEKSTVKSEQEKQKDVLIAERDTAQFDLNIAQAHSQALATQVYAARARTGAAEAHIQAMSEEQGGMLAKAHAMEREKVELEKALAIAKSDIKYVRVSQRKGYQSRDKERELVNKEMRWLMSIAKDITDEGKSRPVLANSLWAVVARFQSLQTRAKAELLASEARGATSAVDLR